MSTTTRKFKTVITDTGAKKLAQAAAPDGKPVRLTHMAVGDGGGTLPTPDSKQTRLVHEVWRHTVNRVILDATHQNRIIAELLIPPETGGFWIREIGVFDEHGDLIAVGNTAESYKPIVAEGSGRAQTFRTILTVSSTATVALTVNNTMVMATVDYWQKGSMRRLMKDEPEYNRIATYQSINDAYVVEDYGKCAMVTGLKFADS